MSKMNDNVVIFLGYKVRKIVVKLCIFFLQFQTRQRNLSKVNVLVTFSVLKQDVDVSLMRQDTFDEKEG